MFKAESGGPCLVKKLNWGKGGGHAPTRAFAPAYFH